MAMLRCCVAASSLYVAAAVTLNAARYPIDSTTAVVTIARSPGDPQWPSSFGITIARRGKVTDNYGYAPWGMQMPVLGDNFKKNNSYDFFVLKAAAAEGGNQQVTLPRVATPGNTTLCVSYTNSTCLPGFAPAAFEHFVAAIVEFGRRPYFEEEEGCILATIDKSLGKDPVHLVANIAGLPIGGSLVPGETDRILFPLASLPTSLDLDVNITITISFGDNSDNPITSITHTRRFIRKPPQPAGSAATAWQVECGSVQQNHMA